MILKFLLILLPNWGGSWQCPYGLYIKYHRHPDTSSLYSKLDRYPAPRVEYESSCAVKTNSNSTASLDISLKVYSFDKSSKCDLILLHKSWSRAYFASIWKCIFIMIVIAIANKIYIKCDVTSERYLMWHTSTHCGLVTPNGDINLSQHWPMQYLVVWRHPNITWTNVDLQ